MENAREEVTLRGVVEHVIYHNDDNGYAVFRVELDGERSVTVVGTVPFVGAGEGVVVTGTWVHHPSYGEQLKASRAERTMPAGAVAIMRYLAEGNVPGIGPVTAKRVVEMFGEETFDVLESHPERLAGLPGITKKKADSICDGFRRQLGMRRLMEYLASFGVPHRTAIQLYKWYGSMALELVRQNPYIVTDEELGVEFSVADGMALQLGFSEDCPQRAEAGVLYELKYNTGNGHVFIPGEKLVPATAGLLKIDEDICASALLRLCRDGRVVEEEISGLGACYIRRLYEAERETAARLRMLAECPAEKVAGLGRLIEGTERALGIEYAPMQREAIAAAATEHVMLLTGGPGTGKSTSVRGMIEIFEYLGLKTVLCSPTGRAAKRLEELTGREAATVHRLLEVDFSGETGGRGFRFVHGEDDPLDADVVILDECSMVDIELMYSVVSALKGGARLILVGDPDQLPSVGPGNVLGDMIASGVIRTVRLTEIFRQAQLSNIVMSAHAVNRGEMPELRQKSGDFFFLKRRSPQAVVETVVDLCTRRLPQSMGIEPSQIQVLSPTRRGVTGTENLNNALQAVLNPPEKGKPERRSGGYIFREGDRVMHIKNNYDLMWSSEDGSSGMGVFNGDVGEVCGIDSRGENLLVKYDDRYVTYPFPLLDELEPAYAITVHKSQGSEYPAVVLVASQAAPQLLNRPVFYTAITRAQNLRVIVGDEGVVETMVKTGRKSKRYSGLRYRLEG